MGELVTYRTRMVDSSRWARFAHRPGDIVISTPPKCGTTWTQMLCALMIFDGPDFPAQLDAMSPWLDLMIRSEYEVFATYERQTHRRFIKTHTPLDGLPLRDDVHYLVVGRDPRDALVSWEHHLDNMDFDVILDSRRAAVGLEDLDEFDPPRRPDPDPAVRFCEFVEADWSPAEFVTLANMLHHLHTGWERRRKPHVGLFHYLDLRRDLVAEMRRMADLCGFDAEPARLGELAAEAGIERMRARADDLTPDISTSDHWKDRTQFFRAGTAGEWAQRTTADDRRRYDERVAALVPTDLARWVHAGRSG